VTGKIKETNPKPESLSSLTAAIEA
jgi:hypothetical protein